MNRTKRENNFSCGSGTKSLSFVVEINASRASAIETNSRGQRTGQYRDIQLVHDRVQIGTEDRPPFSVEHGFIYPCASSRRFHHLTVRIRESLQTQRFSALQQRHRKRM